MDAQTKPAALPTSEPSIFAISFWVGHRPCRRRPLLTSSSSMTSGLTRGNSAAQFWASIHAANLAQRVFLQRVASEQHCARVAELISKVVGPSLLERKFEGRFVVETKFDEAATRKKVWVHSVCGIKSSLKRAFSNY